MRRERAGLYRRAHLRYHSTKAATPYSGDCAMNHIAVRAIIRGKVQRVGYRDWACSAAWTLGVWGYVRNLSDGSVEVMAVGPETAVLELLDACQEGPALAEVSELLKEPWLVEARMPDGAPLSGFLRVA